MSGMLLVPEEWDKRRLIWPAMVLLGLFSFLVGPSSLFGFANSPVLMGVGIALGGASRGVCMALCPTDAVMGGMKKFSDNEAKVSDIVGSLYTLSIGVGNLIFPIVGSALVKSAGFRSGFDIIGVVLLVNSGVYLVSTMKEWKKEREEGAGLEQEEEHSRLLYV